VALDNYGNRYTGRERVGGTVSLIDPLHHGDVLSLNGLSSGRGMDYGRVSYESLLNGLGTRLGGAYSLMHYSLGGPLSALDAHGTVQVESVWVKQPLIRSRDSNLYAQLQYDRLQLRDEIDVGDIKTDRHLDTWTASLIGDARDVFMSGAINSWNLGWTQGHTHFDDAGAQLADADSANTLGSFSKWNAYLARLQNLSPSNGLYLALSGQWANNNLDSSQKMTAGGPYSVRAYDVGAISGDIGILGSMEFRHSLGLILGGQSQAIAFVDSAHVTINKNTWSGATGENSATLSGAGLGLNWTGTNLWSARGYVAAPIGSTPSVVASNSSARGWVEIRRGF
jgi:hemolysin activation/secretion protein